MGFADTGRGTKKNAPRMGLREYFAELLEVPADAAAGVPRMVVSGYRELLLTSHRGVLEYTSEQIRINGGRAIICVTGTDLTIRAMNRTGLAVTGCIRSIEFDE